MWTRLLGLLPLTVLACAKGDTARPAPETARAEEVRVPVVFVEQTSAPSASRCQPFHIGGCADTGCPSGQHCDVSNACTEKKCHCDASGSSICTADCTPALCVPN